MRTLGRLVAMACIIVGLFLIVKHHVSNPVARSINNLENGLLQCEEDNTALTEELALCREFISE